MILQQQKQLSVQQKKLIPKIRNEWLTLCQTQKEITVHDVKEGVAQLYALGDRSTTTTNIPLILILDDPAQCQYLANIIASKKGSKIRSELYSPIYSKIDSEIRSKIDSEIRSKIDSEIDSQIYSQIDSKIDSEIRSEIHSKIRSEIHLQMESKILSEILSEIRSKIDLQMKSHKLEFYGFLGGLSWRSGYTCKCDYYIKSGLLNLDEKQKQIINNQINLLKKGVWDLIVFEDVCIISKCPRIRRDDDNKIHSLTKKAVEFKSGFGFYAIHGVPFDEELWEKVSKRKLSAKQVLSIQNIEQRFASIRHYGMENIFAELDYKLLDKSERGNELYSVNDINPERPVLYLKYKDVSPTGRIFVKGIPDTDDNGNKITTADHAQAWSHHLTAEEYDSLEVES